MKTYMLVLIALLLFTASCTKIQTEPQVITKTQFVCSNGDIADTKEECIAIENQPAPMERRFEEYTLDLDYLGASGSEASGFGDGWIDDTDCLNSTYAKQRDFKVCEVVSVELAFGSEPNPFKSKNMDYEGGTIFGNGAVFKVKCGCYV